MDRPGYKHVETDVEFKARVVPDMNTWCASHARYLLGNELDIFVWDVLHKQRKIVEVFP